MNLTEQNVLNAENYLLELTYKWPDMERPDRVQVWYDKDADLYMAKFDGFATVRNRFFGSVLNYVGRLAEIPDWE